MTIEISNNKELLNIEFIHKYLSEESYWAQGRTLEAVKTSIENSLCFGVFLNNSQIGFARVVTDYAVFAWIMDVFILKEFSGNGYGKQLMNAIVTHKDLQKIKRMGLATKDAHGLYNQYGFTLMSNPEYFMERLNLK